MTDRDKLIELLAQACEWRDRCIGCKNNLPIAETCREEKFGKAADHLIANGVTVQKQIRKIEDCRYYTKTNYGGACLGTKEIDPCEGDWCERWKPKEE